MKVFLAWSGASSHHVAKLLHGWLPDVIQSVEPFMSSEDIRTGTRWFNEIGTQLEQTNFGILCTTPANLDSTWMHFEAGAVSKNVSQARVSAFLFELQSTDIKLPLSQFQHVPTTQQGILKLMLDIDDASPEKKLGKDRVQRAVETNWQKLSDGLAEARRVLADERRGREVQQRRPEEILGDILDTQQGILTRLGQIEQGLSGIDELTPLTQAYIGTNPLSAEKIAKIDALIKRHNRSAAWRRVIGPGDLRTAAAAAAGATVSAPAPAPPRTDKNEKK